MKLCRRKFLHLAAGAAALPVAARAQQPAMPVIGFLSAGSLGPWRQQIAHFQEGLKVSGYVEGQNVAIEYRWAEGQYDRLPALAGDLVRRQVSVIVSGGGAPAALAAKAATSTIPIVFNSGGDPVELGLVASYNRPGGNATGTNNFIGEMDPKRLGFLHQLVPTTALIGILLNPSFPTADIQRRGIEAAARTIGRQIHIVRASSEQDIHAAFTTLAQLRAGALLVGADPFFTSRREQVVTLASQYAIPAIYELREFAVAGGLMSYGVRLTDTYRQLGVYAGRILKGEKPADLPVVQPTKFELVINAQTARMLGLALPRRLLAIADEVIE
jgi:putative tryptophan/tyrosine transport system substrate-binding protein